MKDKMMAKCELIDKCGFFTNYCHNDDEVIQRWIGIFCENGKKSAKCYRKKFFEKNGYKAPYNVTPSGRELPTLSQDNN